MNGFKILKDPNKATVKHIRAKCCKTHAEFIIRLEYNKGNWYMVYATKSENSGYSSISMNNELKLNDGLYVGVDYACPYCGNKNIVCCGSCGYITCSDGGKYFKCEYCKNSGEVSGKIMSVFAEQLSTYIIK